MPTLHDLHDAGQSVWLDFIRRDMLEDGQLATLVADGLRGMTSNPTIFQKAIAGTDLYDAAIAEADGDAQAVFESLAIDDIRAAADALRPVYDASDAADGYVSLEVSPTLAYNTEGTITDAKRLWSRVDRPGLMIKVPAADEGIPAIEELIVVEALTDASHIGQLYEVTGPRLLTFADAIGEIAEASGRRIRYKEILAEEYASLLEKHEVPSEYVSLVMYLFTTVLDGRNEFLTDGVQRVLGREPRDFAEYARETAATGVWAIR